MSTPSMFGLGKRVVGTSGLLHPNSHIRLLSLLVVENGLFVFFLIDENKFKLVGFKWISFIDPSGLWRLLTGGCREDESNISNPFRILTDINGPSFSLHNSYLTGELGTSRTGPVRGRTEVQLGP